MNKIYSGSTLEGVLEKASTELNIEKEKLKYNIIKNKKKFFTRKSQVDIEVIISDEKIEGEIENKPIDDKDGYVYIKDGNLVVVDPKEGGEYPEIVPCEGLVLKINDQIASETTEIKESDVIDVSIPDEQPERSYSIECEPKGYEALLSVTYKKGLKYKLKDTAKNTTVFLQKEVVEEVSPDLYSYAEILNSLQNRKIVFGIINKNIEEAVKNGAEKLQVAKGVQVVNDTDDTIKVYFNTLSKNDKLKEDETGKVDFKSIGHVTSVKAGELLAELIEGEAGVNGKNIFGIEVPRKLGKKITINAGDNVELVGNKVKATVDGRPSGDKNIFSVHLVHEVNGDVDMKSGNIKFIGDIIISGSLRENMSVESSNNVTIQGDVLDGTVNGNGLISIGKNVIHSDIINGGNAVERHKFLEEVEHFASLLEQVANTVKFLIQGNSSIKLIDVINRTIDMKFMEINKLSRKIVSNQEYLGTKLYLVLNEQFPEKRQININKFSELEKTIKLLEEKIKEMKSSELAMNNIEFSYCQDSVLKCTGDIIVSGKGEYISELVAGNEISFISPKSVARGGILSARTIRCGIVGSEAGVNTELKVPKNGHIYAEVVYVNTKFKIGDKEKIVTENIRQVHSYIDKKGDIEIEKFKL